MLWEQEELLDAETHSQILGRAWESYRKGEEGL